MWEVVGEGNLTQPRTRHQTDAAIQEESGKTCMEIRDKEASETVRKPVVQDMSHK